MPKVSSPKRYAQAIFEIALEQNNIDSWTDSLEAIYDVLDSVSIEILDSPQFSKSKLVYASKSWEYNFGMQ